MIGFAAALLLVACSRGLDNGSDAGPDGGPGTGQGGGGVGGTGGLGGAGGTMRPTCPMGTATFSVCAVNDADILPLTGGAGGSGAIHDLITAAPATVEAVGTGAAPAQCRSARVYGAASSSDWWLQVRTADAKLWTIGVGGLGDALMIKTGDSVILDLAYQYTPSFSPSPPAISGQVQISSAAGTPLLWAGLNAYSSGTWLSLTDGQPLCDQLTGLCPTTRYDVMATINGSAATVEPFNATYLGGYYLAVGQYTIVTHIIHTECAFDPPPPFTAAAVKVP